jgi:hypothetical protein
MTPLAKWITAIALWLAFGLLVGVIIAAAEPKVATAVLAVLAGFTYALLITVLFFGRRTL